MKKTSKRTNNKKSIFIFILKLILVITIGYVIGFCFENYQIIKNRNNIGNNDINLDSISINGFEKKDGKLISISENPSIVYDVENSIFINKFIFNYDIDYPVEWDMKYISENYYGVLEEDTIHGFSNQDINIFSEVFKKKVKTISITFATDKEIILSNFRVNNNIVFFSSYYVFFIVLLLSSFLLFYFRKKFKNNVEWIFVILALSFGIIVIFSHEISIGKSWDDQIHFDNAYGMVNETYSKAALHLSDHYGNFLSNDFKRFNTTEEKEAFKKVLNDSQFEDSDYKSESHFNYSKLAYLPQSLVFLVSNFLKIPFSLQVSLAMFVNLLVYILIVFFAIKKAPFAKYLFLTIGLIPTTLFLSSSFSYDPTVTAFMLLGLSYFLYEYSNKDKLKTKNAIVIIASFIIASCTKAVYSPIILLLLFLPKEKFYSKKKCKYFKILCVTLIILLMSTFLLPMLTNTMGSDSRGGDTNVAEQLKLVIKSPISFSKVYIDYPVKQLFDKFIGIQTFMNFAYFGILPNTNVYYLFLIILIFSIFIKNKNIFSKKGKILSAILLFFLYSFVWGSMYLIFTPVGSITINGVQNRYFIPLLFIVLYLLYSDKVKIDIKEDKLYIIYSVILSIVIFASVYYIFL